MSEKIKRPSIRVPEDLHKKVMIHCIQESISFQDYVIMLIKKDLKSKGEL